MLPGEGVGTGIFGEGDAARRLLPVGLRAEETLQRLGEVVEEQRLGPLQAGVRRVEGGEARGQQVEFVATSAEGVPAEIAVPTKVQVGAVDLVEGDAPATGAVARVGDLGVVQHGYLPGRGSRLTAGRPFRFARRVHR